MSESAMCLTADEWTDLAHVCNHYLYVTAWADDPSQYSETSSRWDRHPPPTDALMRQRAVAKRVVAADSAGPR